ncbi:NADH dehydrogenase-like protein [Paraconexibacter sp. AEG42_29]|uniref:NADH:ubiquinone reductase (non-electrogenic) n=1 Tax=Paraconexibacter sp. AEG42_29 TaxID=2997339 RepID=A0AAU7AU51_9ACTN
MPAAETHRIVIVGGGFAGLRVARKLAPRDDVHVTLIDRVNHHLFQPLLYQVATGILSPGQVAPALRSLFRDRANVDVLLAEVDAIDLGTSQVRATGSETLEVPYDTLVVAAGATHSYFGHDEWADVAPGMKSLADAERLRSRLLSAFEAAETTTDAVARRAWLTFVIVGAGPTGVELAGQVAFLARRMLKGEYRHFAPEDTRVVLVDAAPHVLGAFPQPLRAKAQRQLEAMGIEVLLDAAAEGIDADGIDLGGASPGSPARIDSRTIVWAAGVQASPLAHLLAEPSGATLDRAGRLTTEPDLSLPGHPHVFAAGDMIALADVPGVAQAALQEGAYIGDLIARRLDGKAAPKPFAYTDKGSMAVVGRSHAVASVKKLNLSGRLAWMMWAVVHIAFLVGWQNRLETVRRWFWDLTTSNRHERLVDIDDVSSRR